LKDNTSNEASELSPGLSSWDDFLSGSISTATNAKGSSPNKRNQRPESTSPSEGPKKSTNATQRLSSIEDLFPPSLSSTAGQQKNSKGKDQSTSKKFLDGVLPVSDLFFRASQAHKSEKDPVRTPGNANSGPELSSTDPGIAEMAKTPSSKKRTGRKMVRRGMEMLVGGRPVNADPPLRSLEILYNAKEKDWASTVLLSTRDFGPLMHTESVGKVNAVERGLFCEYFVNSALKWDVCPQDLKELVKTHTIQQEKSRADGSLPSLSGQDANRSNGPPERERPTSEFDHNDPPLNGNFRTHDEEDEEDGMLTIQVRKAEDSQKILSYEFGGAIFEFELGLSLADLQSGDPDYAVLKSVLSKGVQLALEKELCGFAVEIPHFAASPVSKNRTSISSEFSMKCVELDQPVDYDDIEKKAVSVMAAFADAVEGDLGLALAEAARQEVRWPERVQDTFVEECLTAEDDEEDEDKQGGQSNPRSLITSYSDADGPFGKKLLYGTEDLYLGNGNDGVFFDHSERNIMNAPYSGQLGLRLLDAVVERAKERHPRVIVIGDVHGCIDELQDLLRQCDYRPGDLVVFLGDLVCKGPDSASVVQMAREIGALGVRGNHDFEVIRWHQAIKSGVDPPVVGSEHYHVASCLSQADVKWMYSLPWFISSKDLSALFVHAGFVSGVRLAKQNPRLMMNMRSILPDGTVTSKFFNNWPWARLWDGPQTVLFGHDADRGLQQYEHAIGLDTGCVYGGRLTACILPEKRLVSVSARKEYFKYRRKKYD
jgi:hypothetical protein